MKMAIPASRLRQRECSQQGRGSCTEPGIQRTSLSPFFWAVSTPNSNQKVAGVQGAHASSSVQLGNQIPAGRNFNLITACICSDDFPKVFTVAQEPCDIQRY